MFCEEPIEVFLSLVERNVIFLTGVPHLLLFYTYMPLCIVSGRFYRYAMQEVANTQTYIHNKLVADVTALEAALIGKCFRFLHFLYIVYTKSVANVALLTHDKLQSLFLTLYFFLFSPL